jgi:hypothetical protein
MIFASFLLMEKKEEKVGELEVLKNRFDELGKDFDKYIHKVSKREARYEKLVPKKEKSGYAKFLVILIIILVVIDVISLIAYFQPDFSKVVKFSNSNSSLPANKSTIKTKCSDGTALNSCSKNKPSYCYQGDLVSKANLCGCPSGYTLDFQSCVKA